MRVQSTANDAMNGYTLLAGKGEDGAKGGLILANFRGRPAHFDVKMKGWAWQGKAACKVYLVDYDRTFSLFTEKHLYHNGVLKLCIPAPAMV